MSAIPRTSAALRSPCRLSHGRRSWPTLVVLKAPSATAGGFTVSERGLLGCAVVAGAGSGLVAGAPAVPVHGEPGPGGAVKDRFTRNRTYYTVFLAELQLAQGDRERAAQTAARVQIADIASIRIAGRLERVIAAASGTP